MGFLTELLLHGRPEHEQEQLTFTDPRIGVLTTSLRRRRRWIRREAKPVDWCSWSGQHLLAGHRVPTAFSVSGDPRGPDRDLVANIHRVLDNLEGIAAKANAALSRRGAAGSFEDFDLINVFDWEQHDAILQLELISRRGPVLEDDLTIYWPGDDELADHHVVFLHLIPHWLGVPPATLHRRTPRRRR